MTALVAHREAKILYDLSLSRSAISRKFVNSLNIAERSNERLTTSISVPCVGGSFTSELSFDIRPRLAKSDAVLGSDWMNLCRMAVDDSVVSFPLGSHEADLVKTHVKSSSSGMSVCVFNYPLQLILSIISARVCIKLV